MLYRASYPLPGFFVTLHKIYFDYLYQKNNLCIAQSRRIGHGCMVYISPVLQKKQRF